MKSVCLSLAHLMPLFILQASMTGGLEDQIFTVLAAVAVVILGFLRAISKFVLKMLLKMLVFLFTEFLVVGLVVLLLMLYFLSNY